MVGCEVGLDGCAEEVVRYYGQRKLDVDDCHAYEQNGEGDEGCEAGEEGDGDGEEEDKR